MAYIRSLDLNYALAKSQDQRDGEAEERLDNLRVPCVLVSRGFVHLAELQAVLSLHLLYAT